MNESTLHKLIKDWALWPSLCESEPQAKHFSPLKNGLTNENWLLHINNKKYVLRLNASNAHALHLNRHAEWHIHQHISQYDLCQPYIFRQKSDIYWMRAFMEGSTLKENIEKNTNFLDEARLEKIAAKFNFLHSLPISNNWPEINHKKRIEHYWNQIFRQLDSQADLKKTLIELRQSIDKKVIYTSYAPTLCHMDANANNWIIDGEKMHLIDWEYAALGNPLWDLAEFCLSCELDKTQTHSFLKSYGIKNLSAFEHAKKQMMYLSLLWFAVQKEISHDDLINQLSQL